MKSVKTILLQLVHDGFLTEQFRKFLVSYCLKVIYQSKNNTFHLPVSGMDCGLVNHCKAQISTCHQIND